MADTEKWVGRSTLELAREAGTQTGSYLWERASGKTVEEAVAAGSHSAAGTRTRSTSLRLAERCARAEEAERTGAVAPKPAPSTFHPEAGECIGLMRARGTGRREAVEQVASHFHHGRANRPALESGLSEVERELREGSPARRCGPRSRADATRRLAELEQTRLRLAADALIDSEVRAELGKRRG